MASQHFAGVLGWPLRTTLSPAIHNAAFRKSGLDWTYFAFPVRPERLVEAIQGLRALGAMGANVTMPHKEAAVQHVDEISGDARAVGAVNTIQRVGDRLVGHNTDVDGFAEFLAGDAGVDVTGKSALVLGAGGAARAVVKALVDLGAAGVTVAARSADRGAALAGIAGSVGRMVRWEDAGHEVDTCTLLVNTTPIGSRDDPRGDPIAEATLNRHHVVIDLVYDPPSTALVIRARAAGCEAWGGLGMLVRQAASSFRIWTGQDPPLETMSAAALRAMRGLSEQAQQ